MEELFAMIFAIIAGVTVGLIIFMPIDKAEKDYYDRIEKRYDIHVTDETEDFIVYNNGGCVALKLPYDELKRIGCGEFGERLTD